MSFYRIHPIRFIAQCHGCEDPARQVVAVMESSYRLPGAECAVTQPISRSWRGRWPGPGCGTWQEVCGSAAWQDEARNFSRGPPCVLGKYDCGLKTRFGRFLTIVNSSWGNPACHAGAGPVHFVQRGSGKISRLARAGASSIGNSGIGSWKEERGLRAKRESRGVACVARNCSIA